VFNVDHSKKKSAVRFNPTAGEVKHYIRDKITVA